MDPCLLVLRRKGKFKVLEQGRRKDSQFKYAAVIILSVRSTYLRRWGIWLGGLTRIAKQCNREGLQLFVMLMTGITRSVANNTYKSSSFGESWFVRSVYAGTVEHLQVSEHAHGACFLFGIEETFRVPFVTVWSPNLGQAVPTT